jgi:hypothetical protein
MSFERSRELMEFVHLNIRREMHGDEKVNGIDLRFRASLSNDVLSEFSSTLKSSLYQREETPQQDFDPATVPLTVVKNPAMGTIKWDLRYDIARVVVHHGVDGSSDVVFGLAKVNKFAITPQQGGTCIVEFRVQISDPEAMDIAKLSAVIGQNVFVTIDPEGGEEEEDSDNGGGAGDLADSIPGAASEDPMYGMAKDLVKTMKKVTVSGIQRHLKIGYERASRLIEQLEADGLVTTEDDKGNRTAVQEKAARGGRRLAAVE